MLVHPTLYWSSQDVSHTMSVVKKNMLQSKASLLSCQRDRAC